ncbi:MAG TPA: hypothetical protein VFI61_03090 [Patescibacteria group bacterium]|nr:hypothetical protein [Patescibacteria group bacterium]
MNEEINQNIPVIEQGTPIVDPTAPKVNLMGKIKDKLPKGVRDFLTRIKLPKKLVLPLAIAGGLILLTIIIGLIFGSPDIKNTIDKSSPTPIAQDKEIISKDDPISQSEARLINLRNQINNLDLKQSRLTPPTLNFNVKF